MARGTTTVRVPGLAKEFELGDWVQDRLFSTTAFAATQSAEVDGLIARAGDVKPGGTATLTPRESNLPRSGGNGLPPGYEMYVYSLRVFLGASIATGSVSLADVRDMYVKTLFKFMIQSKVKSTGPLYAYPQGSDAYVFTTANATTYVSNGQPSERHANAYIIPYELKPDVPFNANFSFDAALSITAQDIEVAAVGLLKRPVT